MDGIAGGERLVVIRSPHGESPGRTGCDFVDSASGVPIKSETVVAETRVRAGVAKAGEEPHGPAAARERYQQVRRTGMVGARSSDFLARCRSVERDRLVRLDPRIFSVRWYHDGRPSKEASSTFLRPDIRYNQTPIVRRRNSSLDLRTPSHEVDTGMGRTDGSARGAMTTPALPSSFAPSAGASGACRRTGFS
jgi:hypothetical protein